MQYSYPRVTAYSKSVHEVIMLVIVGDGEILGFQGFDELALVIFYQKESLLGIIQKI